MQSFVLENDQEATAKPGYCFPNIDEAEKIQTALIHKTGTRILRAEYEICYDERENGNPH